MLKIGKGGGETKGTQLSHKNGFGVRFGLEACTEIAVLQIQVPAEHPFPYSHPAAGDVEQRTNEWHRTDLP